MPIHSSIGKGDDRDSGKFIHIGCGHWRDCRGGLARRERGPAGLRWLRDPSGTTRDTGQNVVSLAVIEAFSGQITSGHSLAVCAGEVGVRHPALRAVGAPMSVCFLFTF
jgi:hypothetical protein